jgi:hypothetical protein
MTSATMATKTVLATRNTKVTMVFANRVLSDLCGQFVFVFLVATV